MVNRMNKKQTITEALFPSLRIVCPGLWHSKIEQLKKSIQFIFISVQQKLILTLAHLI